MTQLGYGKEDLYLGDYLSPGGTKPYDRLIPDLEAVLAQYGKVYLWSVPGFLMLSGYKDHKKPWHPPNTRHYYRTVREALRA